MPKQQQAVLRIPLTPHPLQKQILVALLEEPGVRVVVVGTGRQAGKTETCKMAMVEGAARATKYFKADYGAPTYIRAGEVYEEMCGNLKPLISRKRDAHFTIELKPYGQNREGARFAFRSLEKHDNIRGDNSDLWIVDEMCDVEEAAWKATILPMLMARAGKAAILGTPKRVGVGFAWARAEWLKGLDRSAYPTHRCFAAPSSANPANTAENIALMAQGMPTDVYREEILGEWLDNEGAVFERLDEAFCLPYKAVGATSWVGADKPDRDRRYLIGFDIGAHDDYNIFSVWDLGHRRQVEVWRVRGEDHDDVLGMLHEVRTKWCNADVYADGNGIGLPIVARLAKRYGDGVVDRKWTSNALKVEDVTAARLLFQRQEWKFLAVPWQRAEFQAYTREKRPSGVWDYHAPEGGHDDAVAAACMVAERIKDEWRPRSRGVDAPPPIEVRHGNILVTPEFFQQAEAERKRKRRLWPWNR